MTDVTQKLLTEAIRIIVEVADPEQVILFGSHARGEARTDSDFDLLGIWGHHTYFLYGCKINRYGVSRFGRYGNQGAARSSGVFKGDFSPELRAISLCLMLTTGILKHGNFHS